MSAITTGVIIAASTAAATAGASVYAAKKGASAAKDAAATQSAAADKSLAFQKEQFGAHQQAYAPYQQVGQQSLRGLSQGMAPGGQFNQPFTQPFIAPGQTQPMYSPQQPQTLGGMAPPTGPRPIQPPPYAGRPGLPDQQQPPGQQAPGGPPAASTGALWTIQAPSGEQKQLPPAQAQFYISKGARRIA